MKQVSIYEIWDCEFWVFGLTFSNADYTIGETKLKILFKKWTNFAERCFCRIDTEVDVKKIPSNHIARGLDTDALHTFLAENLSNFVYFIMRLLRTSGVERQRHPPTIIF